MTNVTNDGDSTTDIRKRIATTGLSFRDKTTPGRPRIKIDRPSLPLEEVGPVQIAVWMRELMRSSFRTLL